MSNCTTCKYKADNWCEKRPIIEGTPCEGCPLYSGYCDCLQYCDDNGEYCPLYEEVQDDTCKQI